MFLECTLASDTMGALAHRTHGTRGEDSGKEKLCLDQIPSTPFPAQWSLVLALILYSNISFCFMKWGLYSPNLGRLEAGIVQIDLGFPEA